MADEAVFTNVGRRLNSPEIAILQGSWQSQTYEKIAKDTSYSVSYLKRTVAPKLWKILTQALSEEVSKTNFKSALERRWRKQGRWEGWEQENRGDKLIPSSPSCLKTDWGEAIDVSAFYGRTDELAKLDKWILSDRCRLITILGMGGMGKTAVAAKLAQQVQSEFEYVIWRSLRNTPPIDDTLADLMQFFCVEQNDLPKTLDAKILKLMAVLRNHRCLLILDNTESILQSGDIRNSYREGYEGYGQLFRCIAETTNQSCLVLTSREKPKGLAAKEGENLPIRSISLTGLQLAEAQNIFQHKGKFTGSKPEWELVINHYAGNPFALKIVATGILEVFEGNISKFVEYRKRETLIFNDIHDILQKQFNRLTNIEQSVMYWLAINREPGFFEELQDDLITEKSGSELLEALVSLHRRSLIEKMSMQYIQQAVVMEYVTERFINLCCAEIFKEETILLRSHALTKITTKDYIRESQIRLILEPLVTQINTKLHSQ
ncbi:NB-ARC domain-containing protein [Nostoc sp. UHCC 0302]